MHKIFYLFSVFCYSFRFISLLFLKHFISAILSIKVKHSLQRIHCLPSEHPGRRKKIPSQPHGLTLCCIQKRLPKQSFLFHIFYLSRAILRRHSKSRSMIARCAPHSVRLPSRSSAIRRRLGRHGLTTYVRMRSAKIPPTALPAVMTSRRMIMSAFQAPAT